MISTRLKLLICGILSCAFCWVAYPTDGSLIGHFVTTQPIVSTTSNHNLSLHTNLSEFEFLELVISTGVFGAQPNRTHDEVHAPLLSQEPQTLINFLMLGASAIERFKTTGSHTLLGPAAPFPAVFNAGVSGDKIAQILFRLGTKGLFKALQRRGVRLAVLSIGTNDLRPQIQPVLQREVLQQYLLVLEALWRAAPGVRIAVFGLMPRRDVGEQHIAQSNNGLREVVRVFNEGVGEEVVEYLPPDPRITVNLLVDNLHLNRYGYTILAQEFVDWRTRMSENTTDSIDISLVEAGILDRAQLSAVGPGLKKKSTAST